MEEIIIMLIDIYKWINWVKSVSDGTHRFILCLLSWLVLSDSVKFLRVSQYAAYKVGVDLWVHVLAIVNLLFITLHILVRDIVGWVDRLHWAWVRIRPRWCHWKQNSMNLVLGDYLRINALRLARNRLKFRLSALLFWNNLDLNIIGI